MSLRTNPDRILDNIDRQRTREEEGHAGQDRHAIGRELDITIPDIDATTPERMRRIFSIVESSYTKAAANVELGKLASHFRAVGDIPTHHARGDVSIPHFYVIDSTGTVVREGVPSETEIEALLADTFDPVHRFSPPRRRGNGPLRDLPGASRRG